MERAAVHVPVLADEVVFFLRARRPGWLVDGTVGFGGHAERLLEASAPGARLLGLDGDPEALARAQTRLARFGERARLRHGNFRALASHAAEAGVTEADAVLLDLGLSSYQLDARAAVSPSRATSRSTCVSIPPRASPPRKACQPVAEAELVRVLTSTARSRTRRIARRIVEARAVTLRTTADLVAAVKAAACCGRLPAAPVPTSPPRTFRPRVAVNDEAQALRDALPQAAALLAAEVA
jgi:16S rRNA (cytosine1402-N4)-methyltransferase